MSGDPSSLTSYSHSLPSKSPVTDTAVMGVRNSVSVTLWAIDKWSLDATTDEAYTVIHLQFEMEACRSVEKTLSLCLRR